MRAMAHAERLDFIADGLPNILASARSLWIAAEKLVDNPREALVLEGFAEEEAAKVLILLDLVRCPPDKVEGRIGRIIKHFYSHLARLIYAKAQSWRPVNVTQLQEYVDSERQGHYLEGGMSEYIMPNWAIYSRESTLYADIEQHEDGVAQWSDPTHGASAGMLIRPFALMLIEALEAIGVFSRSGLQATNDIWRDVDFVANEHSGHVRDLTGRLAERLDAEGLVTAAATSEHARWFRHLLADADVQSGLRLSAGIARSAPRRSGGRVLGRDRLGKSWRSLDRATILRTPTSTSSAAISNC